MFNNKIDEYGSNLGVGLNSEDILGISTPPEYQCSHIDSVIAEIKDAQSTIEDVNYYIGWKEYHKLDSYVNNLDRNFKGMNEELEDVRSSIMDLRQWGEEWKIIAKWLIEKSDVTIEEVIKYLKENK